MDSNMGIGEVLLYLFLGFVGINIVIALLYGLAMSTIHLGEFLSLLGKNKSPTLKQKRFHLYTAAAILALLISSVLFGPRVVDGLSTVDRLTNKCRNDSKYYYRVGAICNDGWKSTSTGRGTCSYHGGVQEWIHEKEFRKSISECEEWAKKRSWIE